MTLTLAACLLTTAIVAPLALMVGFSFGAERTRARWAAAEADRAERERGAGMAAERYAKRHREFLNVN